ncbi:hypothetical protein GCM10010276_88150 [Streptomyces longisporus]|uniref:Uncharacterized protein n=1 Tax=Streptomyces longisporus TaxID=1948 RepID=A0ABP6AU63_STRLO
MSSKVLLFIAWSTAERKASTAGDSGSDGGAVKFGEPMSAALRTAGRYFNVFAALRPGGSGALSSQPSRPVLSPNGTTVVRLAATRDHDQASPNRPAIPPASEK